MSTSSRYGLSRRAGSVQSVQSIQSVREGARHRASSRARPVTISYDDAFSFALRVAFLHYLLQPRKKRKEYAPAPKAVHRAHTGVGELMKDFMPSGSTSSSLKLPHGFRSALDKRMSGVLQGIERLPGYNDRALKLTFAEAYNAFTDKDFHENIKKDRKVEPLILIFYSSATKAQSRNRAPDDNSWRPLPDRHLAMFVRLLASMIRDLAGDRDKAELVQRLSTLESKLLTNDQNLSLSAAQEDHSFVEVEIPLTYLVKDMPMVQVVAKIFGLTHTDVQNVLDNSMATWTEEAALKDYKAYHFRLSSNMAGTLRKRDFDMDEAYEDWKRQELSMLAKVFSEILSIRPDLKGSTSGNDKALPARPQSTYGEDQAYAELGLDQSLGLGSMSLDESSSIRAVDEPNYTFIPADPRAVYKVILQYAMSYDLLHADPSAAEAEFPHPLSEETRNLLTELAVRWRIPQYSRDVTFVEVSIRKFLDQEIDHDLLFSCLDTVKEAPAEVKKLPAIQYFSSPLTDLEPSRWTLADFSGYQMALRDLHDALMRDLFNLMLRCYDKQPPSVGPVMALIQRHIQDDPAFSQRPEELADFSRQLEAGLRQSAADRYSDFVNSIIPEDHQNWDFTHVVKLGQEVVSLSQRIKKRYTKNPRVMGVSPHKVLVETVFPSFEVDAQDFIKRVISVAKSRDTELSVEDGFILYEELTKIRRIHMEALPGVPFSFDIEENLIEFVQKWLMHAEERMIEMVGNAIKEDMFQVRTTNPEGFATDEDRHSVSIIDSFRIFRESVDQIKKLNWGVELHHARFMTTLAKSIAAAIGHYCEKVEAAFAREMDRPTEEELAAASKTTQEKFFQYAKEAWNAKERIEPFQFMPESFVKFNNIEYAMHELDKLEKLMDVDRCAEVIRKAEGPRPVVKKPQHYVFTVKIVEAEDLKACDANGSSDPYLVLCDEYQKRLHKTRIIKGSLNPRWDESVDITVSGALNLIATIWDWDLIGDHDFVGRTSLKLDPLHFGDYLPREFWLDLDTQGRLLIRVSMEGERDDIQFHFGKAFRHLKRTERDMVRKITEKLTAHINASLSREALRSLLNRGLAASVASLWKKRQSTVPTLTAADVENALQPLFNYFDDNFAIMKQTLTEATMLAVMTRLWKEVLIAIENLLVPPLSDKPSSQKPLTQPELDVVYRWLELLFAFFNAKDHGTGEVLGVPADVLKSPKWHELASLNFFYTESTENLMRESERMAAANAQRAQQRAQQQLQSSAASNRLSAPPTFGATYTAGFGSLGTIRRGKSIMMSRNLGTMRKAKEEKRREAQADPSDDMILRILRMRPEAAGYLRERHRQRERMAATQQAAMIVRQSVNQGFGSGPAFGGALYGRNNLPQR
ncbi:adenylate cyclase activation protein git1 [Podospora aff. communis PSN243]|uniref:Adenylate cyclase activation protein git1 n=1 Tax=Podospora aff. communis PSN243 TaxID=3040156 RepID=A0AAV9H3V3_9PEZI|nr:adenylate cyclase activation protein git1 [Podospora aff. communis PSN243]